MTINSPKRFPIKHDARMDGRSFAQIITGSKPPSNPSKGNMAGNSEGLICHSTVEDLEWSKRCVVGELQKNWNLDSVRSEFGKEGFHNFQFEAMGNNNILMVADSVDNANGLITEDKGWLRHMFLNIRKWCFNDIIRIRQTWINVYGVPLHGWNVATFSDIGSKWGKVLAIQQDTINKTRLAQGQILVETWLWERIDKKMVITINQQPFPIWIMESSTAIATSSNTWMEDGTDSEEVTSDSEQEDFINTDSFGMIQELGEFNDKRNDSPATQTIGNVIVEEERPPSRETSCMGNHPRAAHAGNGSVNSKNSFNSLVGGLSEGIKEWEPEGPHKEGNEDTVESDLNVTGLENIQATNFNGPVVEEAQDQNLNEGSSQTSSPKLPDGLESDPFKLGPYIEEAFARKQKKNQKKAGKKNTTMGELRKTWNDFVGDMVSDADGKSQRRQVNQKRKPGNKSKLMGFSIEKDREFLIPKLVELEERDRTKMKEGQDKGTEQKETKREIVNTSFCESLWPDKEFGWAYSGSIGAAGGLITLWKNSSFTLDDQWSTEGALAIKGCWMEEKVNINLINIYASHKSKRQQKLWEEIHEWIGNQPDNFWCLCGDFNTTVVQDERKGSSRVNDDKRSRQFNKFIMETELIDLPLLRRKFTWYKDNGSSCSRLDRFLLSAAWYDRWPNAKQIGLKRTFSDHAPICLDVTKKENWGPVPFKIVNWWLDQVEFQQLVEKVWKNTNIEGWGGYVLKEKLKRMKQDIKLWKAKNGTTLSREIEDIERQLTELDTKLESEVWDEVDRNRKRSLMISLEDYRIKKH
ncbi:hypothetical protein ACS0TY_022046 [Phlomoides rotata]